MSYSTIWTSSTDLALTHRITAAVAQETEPGADVPRLAQRVQWPVISAADIEAAYASALAAEDPDPGGNPAVITDAMLLAHVQATLAALPPDDGSLGLPP